MDAADSYLAFYKDGMHSPFPLNVLVDKHGRIARISYAYDSDRMLEEIEKLLVE